MLQNPYQKYVNNSIYTMTPLQGVIALYSKAENEINKAIYYIENKKIEEASNSIIKVQNIVEGLGSVLEKGIEISDDLSRMYEFFIAELTQANISKDIEKLKKLLPLFADLKDAFTQISKQNVTL